jgi:hypothetical protein
MPNHGGRARAEAELRRGTRRSDAIIAAAARCTPQRIGRWRRELADPGQIPPTEPSRAPSASAPGIHDFPVSGSTLNPGDH